MSIQRTISPVDGRVYVERPHATASEIDAALRARRCICGGFLSSLGERSARDGDRVLRVVRAECGRCENEQTVYFDTSVLVH